MSERSNHAEFSGLSAASCTHRTVALQRAQKGHPRLGSVGIQPNYPIGPVTLYWLLSLGRSTHRKQMMEKRETDPN